MIQTDNQVPIADMLKAGYEFPSGSTTFREFAEYCDNLGQAIASTGVFSLMVFIRQDPPPSRPGGPLIVFRVITTTFSDLYSEDHYAEDVVEAWAVRGADWQSSVVAFVERLIRRSAVAAFCHHLKAAGIKA